MFAHMYMCVCIYIYMYIYKYCSDTKELFCGLIYTKMSSINEYSFPELGKSIVAFFDQGKNLLPTSKIYM